MVWSTGRGRIDRSGMTRHVPPPASISDAARRYLESGTQPQPFIPERIAEQRAADRAARQPAIDWATATFAPDIRDTSMGGVPVQVLTPRTYTPDTRPMLYVFGGGFAVGSPDEDLPVFAPVADRLGCRVISPYYRRTPEHPYPAAADDVLAVYRHVCADGPAPFVMGESAGGNLAVGLAIRARDTGLPAPKALAILSPACDLSAGGDSHRLLNDVAPNANYLDRVHGFSASYAGAIDRTDARISPLFADFDAGFPPTIITTGTRDFFLSDCIRLAERLQAAEAEVRLRIWDGLWHVFEWHPDVPEASASLAEIASFLAARDET